MTFEPAKYKYLVCAPGLSTYCNTRVDLDNAILEGLERIKGAPEGVGRYITVYGGGYGSDLPAHRVTIPEWRRHDDRA